MKTVFQKIVYLVVDRFFLNSFLQMFNPFFTLIIIAMLIFFLIN